MSRDLDIQCARVLGWTDIQTHEDVPGTPFDWAQGRNPEGRIENVKDYSTEIVDTLLLEDEIERRGLQYEYIEVLIRIVNVSDLELDQWPKFSDIFALIRATPEQRARAFLEAIK